MVTSVPDDSSRTLLQMRDENDQLRAAVESAHDEITRLAADRERLMDTLTEQAPGLYRMAGDTGPDVAGDTARLTDGERGREVEEELRVAVEEMQVLTEELEAANQQLLEQNADLDRRVADRTAELGAAHVALEASEASFRAVADLVPDYLWRSDPAGEVRWFSRRWYALTGQQDSEALGDGWLAAIHPDDRASCHAAHLAGLRRGGPYQIEARIAGQGDGGRWFLMRAEPFRNEAGDVVQWFGAGTDVHEQRLVYGALQVSEHRFRTLTEGIPQLVWRSRAEGNWTWSSPQWSEFTGLSGEASLGLGWLEAWHPDDRPTAIAAWQRAGADEDFAAEGRIFHIGERRYRHFRTRGKAVHGSEGRTIEWLGTSTDVDDITRLQQQQAVLVAELQHRTRNIMAVVRSMVRRTAQSSANLDDFNERVDARLAALARVQGLLSQRPDSRRIAFDHLLRTEISAHVSLDDAGNGAQVSMSGPPDVPLYSATIQTMALALHELATNAIKYGALSTSTGHLEVTWRLLDSGDPRLFVEWRESGVTDLPAPDDGPRGTGYGRELIERALPYQLQAKTDYRFGHDGVRCTIEVPVADMMDV